MISAAVSSNKKVIETYLASADRSKVAHLLSDDVEWVEWGDGVPPEGVRHRGKTAFIQNFGDDELRTQVKRMTEENNTVVAEGLVTVTKKDGGIVKVQFVDIFELEKGKVKRLDSYGAMLKG